MEGGGLVDPSCKRRAQTKEPLKEKALQKGRWGENKKNKQSAWRGSKMTRQKRSIMLGVLK